MTRRKFEQVTGHEVDISYVEPIWKVSCHCRCVPDVDTRLLEWGKTKEGALKTLLDFVYHHHSKIVMDRAGWKCSECGRSGRLEIDHIKPRGLGSKDRDDRIENLRCVCASFTGCRVHLKKHGG